MKQMTLFFCLFWAVALQAQSLTLPVGGGNYKYRTAQRIGITDVEVHWDAPGVKGREGKIWGTPIAHYGFENLGFGTAKSSPWRAGANENVVMSFSTDVRIEGKSLAAGKYGFFIAVYPDSCTLIFSKNNEAWGSYAYDPAADALRVTVRQQKNQPQSREWLSYEFSDPTQSSATLALVWERWRIPLIISVDLKKTVVESLRSELQGDKGFYDENLYAAADFCLQNDYNLEEALTWAGLAVGNNPSFTNTRLQASILEKLGRGAEAEKALDGAMGRASAQELHQYGRQLVGQKKAAKALEVFQLNFKKHNGEWPTQVGLMRGYSATGDLKKALEHAKLALAQAPDDTNKKNLEASIKTLSEGKALAQ
jgi:tetratricopeptide (TPR) repeat protein